MEMFHVEWWVKPRLECKVFLSIQMGKDNYTLRIREHIQHLKRIKQSLLQKS